MLRHGRASLFSMSVAKEKWHYAMYFDALFHRIARHAKHLCCLKTHITPNGYDVRCEIIIDIFCLISSKLSISQWCERLSSYRRPCRADALFTPQILTSGRRPDKAQSEWYLHAESGNKLQPRHESRISFHARPRAWKRHRWILSSWRRWRPAKFKWRRCASENAWASHMTKHAAISPRYGHEAVAMRY